MDQSIIKGRTGNEQIVTPDENIDNIARAFTRSNEPGTWGDFSSSTKGTKKNPNYLEAAEDVFSFCNEVTMVMLTTSMGVLSNFRKATWKTQIMANVGKFMQQGERESIEWNNARQVLADEEKKLYDQLDKSNELSFPGFELKGMANPEWNQLPGRFGPTTVKLALASKTVMVDWFHQLLGLSNMRKNSSAVWQYTVPDLDKAPDAVKEALTRLSSYELDPAALPEWAKARGAATLVAAEIGIEDFPDQYTEFSKDDQEGYKKLIDDVLTILQFEPRCLPLIHTTMAFYARAINLMFDEDLRNALTMNEEFSIGFNISNAVNDAKRYSGKILEKPTIDDTITAALFCLSSSIAVSYPNPTELQRIASVGGSNQSGSFNQSGGDVANAELQDELLKDLFLDITGIASNAMYTILSKEVIINKRVVFEYEIIPIFDSDKSKDTVIKRIQGFYDGVMTNGKGASAQALETFLIILTIVRKGINLSKIVALANGKDWPRDQKHTLELEISDLIESFRTPKGRAMYQSIELLSRIPIINEIADSLHAYSDNIRGTWGKGMLQIRSLEMKEEGEDGTLVSEFEYTPTLTDLILSTALSLSGDISGEVDVDSQFLQGIYYTGPLYVFVDSGYFQAKSDVFNPSTHVMSGLPCFYSLFVDSLGLKAWLTLIKEQGISADNLGKLNIENEEMRQKLLTVSGFEQFVTNHQSLYLLAVTNGNASKGPQGDAGEDIFKPSIFLYQFLKTVPVKEKWEREATVIMDLAEEYPSIILQLGAVSSKRTERVAPVRAFILYHLHIKTFKH